MDENTENLDISEISEDTKNTESLASDVSEKTENADTSATETESAVSESNNEEAKSDERTEIVGIRFKKEGKTYYFAPNGFKLKSGDKVIVDTQRGDEYGYTAVPNTLVKTSEIVSPLRNVVRLATAEDDRIHTENLRREVEAYNTCIALIDEHNPKMKLIDVECAFDKSKLIFYFSAEERVDFREIVKSLANTFHTRIEMRQIGIRDEAKMLGGLGVCGRPFCCSSFLTDFVQVSVKMAKEQSLSLNAAKISGACGKLMCCLRYEYDTYLAEKALTPKVGARVMTPDGPGEVTDANPLAGIVKVKLDGKADDAEQPVYIRDDVVKEEEYNGEPLKKTEIPKRGKVKEEEDIFASFASVVSSDENKKTAGKPLGNKTDGVQRTSLGSEQQVKMENASSPSDQNAIHTGGGNGKRRKRHRGNKGQGGGQAGGQGNAQQGQNGSQGGNKVAAPQSQGNGGKGTEARAAVQGQQHQNKPQQGNGGTDRGNGAQNQNRDHGNKNKKKHFKPYHKKFDVGGDSSAK